MRKVDAPDGRALLDEYEARRLVANAARKAQREAAKTPAEVVAAPAAAEEAPAEKRGWFR